MQTSDSTILTDEEIKKASCQYSKDQGPIPTAVAFQAGARWAREMHHNNANSNIQLTMKEPLSIDTGPSRMTAKSIIEDHVKRHERRASQLRILLAALPSELTQEQDDAIWSIICDLPRP